MIELEFFQENCRKKVKLCKILAISHSKKYSFLYLKKILNATRVIKEQNIQHTNNILNSACLLNREIAKIIHTIQVKTTSSQKNQEYFFLFFLSFIVYLPFESSLSVDFKKFYTYIIPHLHNFVKSFSNPL